MIFFFFFMVSAFSTVNVAREILMLQPSEHSNRRRFVETLQFVHDRLAARSLRSGMQPVTHSVLKDRT